MLTPEYLTAQPPRRTGPRATRSTAVRRDDGGRGRVGRDARRREPREIGRRGKAPSRSQPARRQRTKEAQENEQAAHYVIATIVRASVNLPVWDTERGVSGVNGT